VLLQSFRSNPQTGEIVGDVQPFCRETIGGWTTVSTETPSAGATGVAGVAYFVSGRRAWW
jgi:hypothetical protein